MAFVRQKVSRGRSAYYLVENHRQDGKVRQRVLAYLGPCSTLDEAISGIRRRWEWLTARVLRLEEQAAGQKARALALEEKFPCLRERCGGDLPNPPRRPGGWSYSGSYKAICARYWYLRESAADLKKQADTMHERIEHLRSFRSQTDEGQK